MEQKEMVAVTGGFGYVLAKFGAVELTGEQRISAAELAFCQRHEQIFNETIAVLKQMNEAISGVYETYKNECNDISTYDGANFFSRYDDMDFCSRRIDNIYNSFVSRITRYFTKRYNVQLSSEAIQKKYDADTISYNIILDEIFEQLGGLTFTEKAVAELKAASKNVVYNADKITITKKKLAIADFAWFSTSWDNSLSIGYNDRRAQPLFLALSHLISGKTTITHELQQIYHELNKGSKEYDIFEKYELVNDVVQAMKFYKNGKVELFFADNETAERFKTTYLV